MIERFEKLYWLINIALPVIALILLIDGFFDEEAGYLLLIAILMWVIRWVVTGNHLTDNPYTGKSLIKDKTKNLDETNLIHTSNSLRKKITRLTLIMTHGKKLVNALKPLKIFNH